MYEDSKGRHWPPLAQGLEAQGSACWHDFPRRQEEGQLLPKPPCEPMADLDIMEVPTRDRSKVLSS